MKKIWKNSKVELVNEKLRRCRSHWLLRHVTRMNNRMQKKKNKSNKFGILDEMDEDGLEDL